MKYRIFSGIFFEMASRPLTKPPPWRRRVQGANLFMVVADHVHLITVMDASPVPVDAQMGESVQPKKSAHGSWPGFGMATAKPRASWTAPSDWNA